LPLVALGRLRWHMGRFEFESRIGLRRELWNDVVQLENGENATVKCESKLCITCLFWDSGSTTQVVSFLWRNEQKQEIYVHFILTELISFLIISSTSSTVINNYFNLTMSH
jgi:hypothetical protein